MAWWGKALGGAFGFLFGGPLGALAGVAFGHNFDRGLNSTSQADGPGDQQSRIQTAFFTTCFSVMGHIAKADGRVTAAEIQLAAEVMNELGLNTEMQASAQRLFNQGKSTDFPIDAVLTQFRKEVGRQANLIQMFLEIQIQAAYADGILHPAEQKALTHICQVLRIPLSQLKHWMDALQSGFDGRQTTENPASLAAAYSTLGVHAEAGDTEVKKAYRRLMSQHHPDKLVAKGLPEQMIGVANERTRQIKSAYDRIRTARSKGQQ